MLFWNPGSRSSYRRGVSADGVDAAFMLYYPIIAYLSCGVMPFPLFLTIRHFLSTQS